MSGARDVAPTALVVAKVAGAGAEFTAITLEGPNGLIAGTSAYDSATGSLSFEPTAPLGWATEYRAAVVAGDPLVALLSWTFTTAQEPIVVVASSILPPDAVPLNEAWDDTAAVQVGVRFSASTPGTVTAIRFYKGAANTGAHTCYLWSPDGVLLASIALENETGVGWQLATLSEPVLLQAGLEYRATVHSTTGRYAVDLNGLAQPTSSGPLSTPAQGSTYRYGIEYPEATSSHNYWVDVLFQAQG